MKTENKKLVITTVEAPDPAKDIVTVTVKGKDNTGDGDPKDVTVTLTVSPPPPKLEHKDATPNVTPKQTSAGLVYKWTDRWPNTEGGTYVAKVKCNGAGVGKAEATIVMKWQGNTAQDSDDDTFTC